MKTLTLIICLLMQTSNSIGYKEKAQEAFAYCSSKGFNTDFFFLVDMSVHSGLKRFHLWDFKKKRITESFMVSHGCGENPWAEDFTKDRPSFSNIDGSHLTSTGKYAIGERGYSQWGIGVKYIMHGMDRTNSNALRRTIVLHSWTMVSDHETYPKGTPEGWGCPAVSNNDMRKIDAMLRYNKKKTLLWIIS